MAFGGAGPLHAARLARELEIPRVLVPRNPGILRALGLLLGDLRTDEAQTRLMPATEASLPRMVETFEELVRRAEAWFAREGITPRGARSCSGAPSTCGTPVRTTSCRWPSPMRRRGRR